METKKQNNYSAVNLFQANVPFLHPLKTAETLLFFRCVLGVKKGNIGLKWIDNSGREIISIRNNATLIYGINGQNTTSTSASNNNVINGVTIFISEKFKGLCEWYFKSDIAEFEFDCTNKTKLKTFTDKMRNLTKFSIFFSFPFKPLMTWSIYGKKTWRAWLKDLLLTQIYWLMIDHWYFFSALPPNNHKNRDLDGSWWQNYKDQKSRHSFHVTSRVIEWRHEPSGHTSNIIFISPWRVEFWIWYVSTDRFVWCMIILVDKFCNICDVNNTCTGRLIPV